MRTLVVSTDPAHSLGDALQCQAEGINLDGTPKLIDSTPAGGQLWAMEIDPKQALAEFRELLQSATSNMNGDSKGSEQGGGMFGGMMPNLKGELNDLLNGVNEPPAGTDEIVALTKLMRYLDKGFETSDGRIIRFDNIVLDTAPTGHTLRMLELPKFLIQFISKLKTIRDKLSPLTGGGATKSDGKKDSNVGKGKVIDYDEFLRTGRIDTDDEDKASTAEETVDRLEAFQSNMKKLETMLHDPLSCEFSIVTIPTELATAETCRLMLDLKDENILMRRIIINQVISDEQENSSSNQDESMFLKRLRMNQLRGLNELKTLGNMKSLPIIDVPYFDMEVRTVYGLRMIGNYIFS
jgi:arsenite-transporting ATPase